MIAEEVLEQLREDSGKVFLELIPGQYVVTGRGNVSVRCPLGVHDDTQASFSYNPDVGMWRCFACGAAGDVFRLVMELEGLNFTAAVRRVAEITGRNDLLTRKRPENTPAASRERSLYANRTKICEALVRWHREWSIHFAKQVREARNSIEYIAETVFLAKKRWPTLDHWLVDEAIRGHAKACQRLMQFEYLADEFSRAAGDIAAIGRLFAEHYAPEKF